MRTNSEQWTGWGNTVHTVRETLCTSRDLYTTHSVGVMLRVHMSGTFPTASHLIYYGFSTAFRSVFTSVAVKVLPITHRTYNNNDFLKINLNLFLIGSPV
jgi:hypothetical protein